MDGLATRALIVAQQALSRIGLNSLLKLDGRFAEIAEASSLEELIALLTASVGLLIIDFALVAQGASSLRSLKRVSPEAKFIFLTENGERESVISALSSGADGVITKSSSSEEIRFALKRVLGGDVYVPPSMTSLSSPSIEDPPSAACPLPGDLTDRQWAVMRLVCRGYSNKETARALAISEGTVKVHVRRSFRKLGVRSRFAAAQMLRAQL